MATISRIAICRDVEAHVRHTKRLAELLDVPMYEDGSGYNFYQFNYRNREKDE